MTSLNCSRPCVVPPARESDVHEAVPGVPLPPTPHPSWLSTMIEELRPAYDKATWPRLFADTRDGKHPPLVSWQRALRDFFIVVEAFPKYVGLSLAKTTYGRRRGDARIRRWLLMNLAIEARHAEWYVDWMRASGVPMDDAFDARPCDEIRALHDHLWRVAATGSLAEGIAAASWAIEGVTSLWSRGVLEPFRQYAADGATIDTKSMLWLHAQARYDDARPEEALEAIKLLVDDDDYEAHERIRSAAERSLDLFGKGMERCFVEGLEQRPDR